ncbi:Transporter [Dirofilaria immitis]|nr:Transporter [Dirofilaria immitis]
MSCKSGRPIQDVAQEGPGLVFVVYPEALATMPGASFGGSEAIITALSDEFPLLKRHREYFVAILFSFYMLIGIAICTKGGILIMEWLIVYGTSWSLLIAVFWEAIDIIGVSVGPLSTIISYFTTYEPLKYQDFVYPQIANILGFLFSFSSISAIFIVGFYKLYIEEGDTFIMAQLNNKISKISFTATTRIQKLKAVLTPHRLDRSNNKKMIGFVPNEINL